MGYGVRPSGYLGWGYTGMTNIAEPIDSKKAQGWAVSEKPASSYFNWLIQKQDQWIQYLAWKDSLTTVVSEDFAYSQEHLNGASAIGWAAVPNAGVLFGPNLQGTTRKQMGAAFLNWGGISGIEEMSRYVGQVEGRDVYMQFLYAFAGRSTDLPMELGLFYQSGVSGYKGPLFGFVGTGGTGPFMFQVWPSGAGAPTQVSLGMTFTNPTNIAKWTVESRGPTMAIYMDDVFLAAMPSVPFGASGAGLNIGARVCATGVSSFAQGYLDQVELRVKRP